METDQEERLTFEDLAEFYTASGKLQKSLVLPPVAEEFHDIHRLTMKAIEADLERWDQSDWAYSKELLGLFLDINDEDALAKIQAEEMDYQNFCDTTYCYAGFALLAAGYAIRYTSDAGTVAVLDGESVELHDATKKVLGLTETQACILYEFPHGDLATFKENMTKLTGITFD
jgi:hypothetical protein